MAADEYMVTGEASRGLSWSTVGSVDIYTFKLYLLSKID